MNDGSQAWENIYARDGRVFTEYLPAFQAAVERFGVQGTRRILDLGCGNGRHLVGFGKLGFEVVGLDLSPSGLGVARDWLAEEAIREHLVLGDMRRCLPFAEGSFGGVFSTQVIHHALLEEIRLTISEIWRVLAPGGLAFVTVAGRKDPSKAFQEIEPGTFVPLEGDEKGLPHHIFSERELRREFSRFAILERGPADEGRVLKIWAQKGTPPS